MWFWAHLGVLGAAPVPMLGPAFDMDGAHYVTVSIVEQKNMSGCVGAFMQPFSHLSQATTRDPGSYAPPMISQQVSCFAAFIRCMMHLFAFCFPFSQQEKPKLKNNRAGGNKQMTRSYVPLVSLPLLVSRLGRPPLLSWFSHGGIKNVLF